MSISPAMRASARAAYRCLIRASASTFPGDERILNAFRSKIRSQNTLLRLERNPKTYEENVKLAREIAQVLRRNVVQAVKIQDAQKENHWKLNLTSDTELGSNETIKNATCRVQNLVDPVNVVPRYYSKLKQAHRDRCMPELKESDLEESFVRGSGPGGQSINKTENNVQLLHKPSGIRVTCQETRSLQTNRRLARRLLLEKLDKLQNPGLSKGELQRAKQRERERRRRKKAKRRDQEKGNNTSDK